MLTRVLIASPTEEITEEKIKQRLEFLFYEPVTHIDAYTVWDDGENNILNGPRISPVKAIRVRYASTPSS
jgi:hypothetical protein